MQAIDVLRLSLIRHFPGASLSIFDGTSLLWQIDPIVREYPELFLKARKLLKEEFIGQIGPASATHTSSS